MNVYIEWVDMPGGERLVTDGPFAFVQLTYDTIRAERPGESDDIILGLRYQDGGGWIRNGDQSFGTPDPMLPDQVQGWYSDISISTVQP